MMRTIVIVFLLLAGQVVYAESALPKDLFKELRDSVSMKDGDIVYIDFWASWCNPCRKSFPWLNEMQSKYKDRGFKVLAINVDTERDLAERFLQKTPANFSVMYDPEGRFAKAFKLQGMPSSFLLNDKGELVISHKGFFEKKTDLYEKEIVSLLQK